MNYLLDTHTLLWDLINTKKLSTQVKKILSNPESGIFISTISLWEISLKYRIGKLELEGKNPDEIPGAAKASGFNILTMDEDVAATFFRFPISKNQDPFDLMLAWQAISKDFVLLTKDPEFKSYNKYGLKIIW